MASAFIERLLSILSDEFAGVECVHRQPAQPPSGARHLLDGNRFDSVVGAFLGHFSVELLPPPSRSYVEKAIPLRSVVENRR